MSKWNQNSISTPPNPPPQSSSPNGAVPVSAFSLIPSSSTISAGMTTDKLRLPTRVTLRIYFFIRTVYHPLRNVLRSMLHSNNRNPNVRHTKRKRTVDRRFFLVLTQPHSLITSHHNISQRGTKESQNMLRNKYPTTKPQSVLLF
jgi:hypothetical protein